MKYIVLVLAISILVGCNQQSDNSQLLRERIDSLQSRVDNAYSPGLGEFMSGIQTHHAKLWFAGSSANWELADFEMHEIDEALEDIEKFNSHRPEVKAIGMIEPAIDSVTYAIKQRDLAEFKNSYTILTNSCNNCHRATGHGYNVIITPSISPTSNQNFKPL